MLHDLPRGLTIWYALYRCVIPTTISWPIGNDPFSTNIIELASSPRRDHNQPASEATIRVFSIGQGARNTSQQISRQDHVHLTIKGCLGVGKPISVCIKVYHITVGATPTIPLANQTPSVTAAAYCVCPNSSLQLIRGELCSPWVSSQRLPAVCPSEDSAGMSCRWSALEARAGLQALV